MVVMLKITTRPGATRDTPLRRGINIRCHPREVGDPGIDRYAFYSPLAPDPLPEGEETYMHV